MSQRIEKKVGDLIDFDTRSVTFIRPYKVKDTSGTEVEVTGVVLDLMKGTHEKEISKVKQNMHVHKLLSILLKSLIVSTIGGKLGKDGIHELVDGLYEDDKRLLLIAHYGFSFNEHPELSKVCVCGRTLRHEYDIADVVIDTTDATETEYSELRNGFQFGDKNVKKFKCVRPVNAKFDSLNMSSDNPLEIKRGMVRRVVKFEGVDALPERIYEDEITSKDTNTILMAYSEAFVSKFSSMEPIECECGERHIIDLEPSAFVAGE